MTGWLRIAVALTVFGLLTPPLALAQWLALRFNWPLARLIARLWHRLVLKCLGMKSKVIGELSSQRPLLVCANHISWVDIMLIGAHADVRFIAKSDVAGWPGMGTIARLNRTVFVERERKTKTGDKAGEIAARLAGGDALVLFAEGTTSDGNTLLPFKTSLFGAARLAIDEAGAEIVYIQPVAVGYPRLHGLPLGRFGRIVYSWVGDIGLAPSIFQITRERGLDAELRFGEPIAFSATSSRKEIAREAEFAVRAMFEEIKTGVPQSSSRQPSGKTAEVIQTHH